jgi:hypothetical protein
MMQRVECGQALEREHLLGKVSEHGWVARRWGWHSEFFFHRFKSRLATKAFPLDGIICAECGSVSTLAWVVVARMHLPPRQIRHKCGLSFPDSLPVTLKEWASYGQFQLLGVGWILHLLLSTDPTPIYL